MPMFLVIFMMSILQILYSADNRGIRFPARSEAGRGELGVPVRLVTYFSNGTAMIAVPLRLPTSLIVPSG